MRHSLSVHVAIVSDLLVVLVGRHGLVGSVRRVYVMVVRKNSRYFEIFQLFPLQNRFNLTFAAERLSAHHCQQQRQHEDEEDEAPLSWMKEALLEVAPLSEMKKC
jgi:hypothetical protein